jgi:hypothetical protein
LLVKQAEKLQLFNPESACESVIRVTHKVNPNKAQSLTQVQATSRPQQNFFQDVYEMI